MQKGGVISIVLGSFFLCLPVFAFNYDAGIQAKDVFFDKDELIMGQPMRIYAVVKNYGEKDLEAYVSFYQGSSLIGQSQPISLRASGLEEEVFVDWTVPEGDFNILARIQGQKPQDENTANDETITNIFIPDRDADNDGVGNRIDEDDDNDGISDAQEKTQGLDPLRADTDGDGVSDGQDLYPLDSTKFKNDPPPAPKVVAQTVTQQKRPVVEAPAPQIPVEPTVVTETPLAVVDLEAPVVVEEPGEPRMQDPQALVVKSTRFSWKVFGFEVSLTPGAQYEWQFPDGQKVLGNKSVKEFVGPGTYAVTLRETKEGVVKEATTQVVVPYFHPANMMLWMWVGFAGLIGVLLTFLFWFVIRKWKH